MKMVEQNARSGHGRFEAEEVGLREAIWGDEVMEVKLGEVPESPALLEGQQGHV